MLWCNVLISLIFVSFTTNVQSLENGLERTPAMGWISWIGYGCDTTCHSQSDDCMSERMIMDAADLLVSEGYKSIGYDHIIIDGCWHHNIKDNDTGEMLPDLKRFPNGMQYLADYVHSKGLKFGIYYVIREHIDYEKYLKLDADTFAKWGVDYMKFNFLSDAESMDRVYRKFGKLLNETGRPMSYACSWPFYQRIAQDTINFDILKNTCNSWRYWNDIQNSYESLRSIINQFGDVQKNIQPHAGPGHFNNPDMLMIGNSGLTVDQSRTQMAIWAILAAPLMMSHHLKYIGPELKQILLNKQIIAVNQDPMGMQGKRVMSDAKNEVWIRPIQPVYNGSYSFAVAISSKHDGWSPYLVSVNLTHIQLNHSDGYYVVDLFNNNTSEYQTDGGNFSTMVKPSGTAFFKFTPIRVENFARSSVLKSPDSNMIVWGFLAICLVLVGFGLAYVYMENGARESINVKYERFAGYRSRLSFWKRQETKDDLLNNIVL